VKDKLENIQHGGKANMFLRKSSGALSRGWGEEEKEKGFGVGSLTRKNRNERMNKRQRYVTIWVNRPKRH
jgi:hypothetical protein